MYPAPPKLGLPLNVGFKLCPEHFKLAETEPLKFKEELDAMARHQRNRIRAGNQSEDQSS
jgi:hypothetical protein